MSKEGAIIFMLNDGSYVFPWREHLRRYSGKRYGFDVQNEGERKSESKGMCTSWLCSESMRWKSRQMVSILLKDFPNVSCFFNLSIRRFQHRNSSTKIFCWCWIHLEILMNIWGIFLDIPCTSTMIIYADICDKKWCVKQQTLLEKSWFCTDGAEK